MNMTDPNLVEIDGAFYKEAQHLTTGDRKIFNSGIGDEIWTVVKPAEVADGGHAPRAVGVAFRHENGQHHYPVWSVGQIIKVEEVLS